MAELTLEESLRQILPTLPLPTQKFFQQRKLGEVARLLTERYALHIDQGAILERELMLLLLGLENPEQFAEALYAELPISKQTVQDIITDINQEVFVPLRNEMMQKPAVTGTRAPASPPPPRPSAPTPAGPTATPPRFFHLENKLALRPTQSVQRPITPVPAIAMPTASQPVQPQVPPQATQSSTLAQAIGNALNAKPKVVQPRAPFSNIAPLPPKFVSPRPIVAPSVGGPIKLGTQPSPEPSKLLEDHEEPHIELGKAPMPPRPAPAFAPKMQPVMPKAAPQIPPRPVTPFSAPVPPSLPGAMPPFPVPDIGVQTPPLNNPPSGLSGDRSVTQNGLASAPVAPTKSYSADPYREPIE